jgi:hypothetical protein
MYYCGSEIKKVEVDWTFSLSGDDKFIEHFGGDYFENGNLEE